jgi:hypothetical protein
VCGSGAGGTETENGECAAKMKRSRGRARRVGGQQVNEMYEPLASPLDCERHIFIILAKKAAKAGVGEREYDENDERG